MDLSRLDECLHLVDGRGRAAVFGTPVDQRQRSHTGLKFEYPVERGVTTAEDSDRLALEHLGVANLVEKRLVFVLLYAFQSHAPRLE